MSLRVVLLAEGGSELGLPAGIGPAPGTVLEPSELGAAHHLVARCLERIRGIPTAAVRFEEPLRNRGRLARGSDLHTPRILQRLVAYSSSDHVGRDVRIEIARACDLDLLKAKNGLSKNGSFETFLSNRKDLAT